MGKIPPTSVEELYFAYMREKNARKQSEMVLQTKTRELYMANQQLSRTNHALQQHQNAKIQREKLAALGTLVAGMAHEINNPLSFVISNINNLQHYVEVFTQIIQKMVQLEGISREQVEQIYITEMAEFSHLDFDGMVFDTQAVFSETNEGLQRIRDIVINLKNFSRKDETNIATYDLSVCVQSALTILSCQLKSRCQVQLELQSVSRMVFNPNLMTQVLINLVTNALEAIPHDKAGIIKIRSWEEGRVVKLSVSDNGCGIPPEIIDDIFVPFYTTKPVGMGTGLGLSICYEKVIEMGGTIEVNSQPGVGSCFTLLFDLDSPHCKYPNRPE